MVREDVYVDRRQQKSNRSHAMYLKLVVELLNLCWYLCIMVPLIKMIAFLSIFYMNILFLTHAFSKKAKDDRKNGKH